MKQTPSPLLLSDTVAGHPTWRLWWHRGLLRWGWPGLLGLLMTLMGVASAGLALHAYLGLSGVYKVARAQNEARFSNAQSVGAVPTAPSRAHALTETLPRRDDGLRIIGQSQRAAQRYQLIWQAADFRYKPATSESLAQLEVNASLHGNYKSIRLWLDQLKSEFTSVSLQQASFSRPNVDVSDVDAKVMLIFGLADEPENGIHASAPASQLRSGALTPATEQSRGLNAAKSPAEIKR
jgi:hypothetical protein